MSDESWDLLQNAIDSLNHVVRHKASFSQCPPAVQDEILGALSDLQEILSIEENQED